MSRNYICMYYVCIICMFHEVLYLQYIVDVTSTYLAAVQPPPLPLYHLPSRPMSAPWHWRRTWRPQPTHWRSSSVGRRVRLLVHCGVRLNGENIDTVLGKIVKWNRLSCIISIILFSCYNSASRRVRLLVHCGARLSGEKYSQDEI